MNENIIIFNELLLITLFLTYLRVVAINKQKMNLNIINLVFGMYIIVFIITRITYNLMTSLFVIFIITLLILIIAFSIKKPR